MTKKRRRRLHPLAPVAIMCSLLVVTLIIAGQRLASLSNTPGLDSDQTTAAGLTASSSGQANLRDLKIDFGQPEDARQSMMRQWPAASSVETIHQPDLGRYSSLANSGQPLSGILVILDPGHGGQDHGACFPSGSDQPTASEKTLTLAVSLKTRDVLEHMGATVVMTRSDDDWVSLYARVAITGQTLLDRFINELPAAGRNRVGLEQLPALLDTVVQINSDAAESGGRGIFAGYGVCENQRLIMDVEGQYDDALFLSLHCNALENDSLCHGVQIFYTSAEKVYEAECAEIAGQDHLTAAPAYRFYDDDARCELAAVLYTTITDNQPDLAYQGDSAVIDSNYAVLRETNLTSALIEMGFITNNQDRARLQSAAGQQQMADSIAEAVYRFYCQ